MLRHCWHTSTQCLSVATAASKRSTGPALGKARAPGSKHQIFEVVGRRDRQRPCTRMNLRAVPVFCALLVSASTVTIAQTIPPPSRTVYKCDVGGKTIYSDSPCLGAERVDVEPSRGLTTNPGRDALGADVRREQRREGLAEAMRPLTGLNAKQFETQGRRMKLSADAQRECRRLDADIPAAEAQERRTATRERGEVQFRIFNMRQLVRNLRC